MPVLYWVRTHHKHNNHDGTQALLYNHISFIYIDVFLLKRPGSEADYCKSQIQEAQAYGAQLSTIEKDELFKNALLGLLGSKGHFSATQILDLLNQYKDITDEKLRKHLAYFLKEIIPVAKANKVNLAIYPDDPPFSVLGLPRVVRNYLDLKIVFEAVPDSCNGLCYCTGSLGTDPENNLLEMIDKFSDRIHFLHWRNIKRYNENIFQESEHLKGDNPIEKIVLKLLKVMQERMVNLPLRPDPGFLYSFEKVKNSYPGYFLTGRLKGLAELKGLELGFI